MFQWNRLSLDISRKKSRSLVQYLPLRPQQAILGKNQIMGINSISLSQSRRGGNAVHPVQQRITTNMTYVV
jgi:hypothetical protein